MNPEEQTTPKVEARDAVITEKSPFGNKISVIFISIATFILTGIAIFTAYRLFQTKNETSPTAPESQPLAQNQATITPQPTNIPPSPTPSTIPTTPTPTPPRLSPTATPSPTRTPTPSITGVLSPTPSPSLPDAGFKLPTIFLFIFSTFLIIASITLFII